MAVDGAFGGALASMRSGTLTPNQAAVLQEGMFELGKDMSRDLPPEYSQHAQSEGGLSPMEVSELSGQLAAKGAFGDAQSVHFTLADVGPNNHWVAAVTHADGSVTGSDPSPNAKGTAPTFSADTPIVPGHENYVGDVTLTPQGGGQTHYELRLATDHGVQSIEKTTAGAPRVWE